MAERNAAARRAQALSNAIAALGENPFRLLVDSVRDYAIFLLDAEGRVLTWNVGAQRIRGYEADEVLGRACEIYYPKEAVRSGWPREELRAAAELRHLEDEGGRVRK